MIPGPSYLAGRFKLLIPPSEWRKTELLHCKSETATTKNQITCKFFFVFAG
jgi:hypothetical protein